MTLQRVVRFILLTCTTLLLLALARLALSGAVQQRRHSHTVGQKVETVVQVICGILTLLTAFTSFRWRKWAPPVRTAWGVSLATAAGLSALVWGPPMPQVGVVFVVGSMLVARTITWALRTALGD